MPSSTVSLESLSSPSPSPPPAEPEEQHEQHSGAGLDSGSELSELTEDEQDNDGAIDDEVPRASARKKKQQRASVVPQPMWDWATKKKPEKKDKADWRSKFEEEEEEEQPGPAEAMEEEEEDDYAQYKDSESERDLTPDMEENGDGHGDGVSDNEVDENEQDPPEDEDESGDEVPFQTAIAVPNGNVSGDEVYDPEDAEPEPDALDDPQSPKAVASPALTDDENHDAGEDEVDDEDVPETGEITKEGSEVDEEELPADDVDADADIPVEDEQPTTEAVTPVEGVVDAADPDPDATMDVDVVLPVLPSPVAGTSIMAGLLRPPSPSSSQPSTPSASRLSSRYPSVEPEQEQDVPSEPEAEPEPERKPSGRAARNRKTKPRTRAARRSRAAAPAEAGDGDPDADQAELPEGEGADADDLEVPTPELDLDADMQPAHRAEALDELAKIELKFALLRERLYVEKMDSLAWEEGLIADGTHPELLHLHAELSSRRDKRLELAARRRDYEIANVTKRRRLDEAGAWSSWSNARDELQTQMIAETNGKKRKLERERRTLERPPPPRRFPLPLHEVPPAPSLSEIVQSSPFGLPESASALLRRTSRKKESASQIPLAYPTLAPLSRHEIIQDLDHFYSHRHVPVGYDPHRNVTGPMNPVLGGIPQGMDPYAMGMHMMDGPNRFGPPIQQQHLPQQGMVQGFPPPPRLSHQHSAPSGGLPHVPSHHQLQLEQEMQMRQPPGMQHLHVAQQFGGGPGPGTLMRRSISPVPLNGAGPGAGVPTTIGGGPVPPAFANPKSNGWPGGRESKRINGEGEGRERERMSDVISQREKERAERERLSRDRDRERDREREREAERTYHMSHTQPRHPGHQHPHQHAHNNTQVQAAHHHPPHNHQHHHHHVHHHHHHVPPQQGFPGPPVGHAPPMTGLPPGSVSGPSVQTSSPRGGREFEQRHPRSGPPTEVIELSAPVQKPPANSSPMSAFWKSEALPSGQHLPIDRERDRERDRDRERAPPGLLGPSQPDVHDRLMTPFTMGPSQIQRDLSSAGSPRKTHGPAGASNPPATRRGSWSTDDHPLARPPSATLGPAGSVGQRPGSSRLPHPPPTSSFHSPYGSGSPPNDNGRGPTHPSSPSAFAGSLRSPVRSAQPGRMPLGGPRSPPPQGPQSQRHVGSPGMRHARGPSPGLPTTLPKLDNFPLPEDGRMAKIASMSDPHPQLHPSPVSSEVGPTLPPLPITLPPPRIPNGTLATDRVVGSQPTKTVSVDGP